LKIPLFWRGMGGLKSWFRQFNSNKNGIFANPHQRKKMNMNNIINQLQAKRILILGFGREGKSSYRFIRKHLPHLPLVVADENPDIETHLFENDVYTKNILYEKDSETFADYDMVLKSPGICLKDKLNQIDRSKISSQTDLFLQAFSPQCIGITGTKGKSTTASLLFHVLKNLYPNTLIAGNIGIPLFDIVEQMDAETKIVIELSSHQLEFVRKSPHISILLNLFEEHLDHYNSYKDYQLAKFNIARYQSDNDYFIYNLNDKRIADLLESMPVASCCLRFFKELSETFVNAETFPLKGEHNLENVAAVIVALCCMKGLDTQKISELLHSFKSLPHRLEPIGEIDGIYFYNDSISTIPQASIAAVKALKNVNTLILGGMDRGVDYSPLVDFLKESGVENFIFTGDAGKRIMELFGKQEETPKNLIRLCGLDPQSPESSAGDSCFRRNDGVDWNDGLIFRSSQENKNFFFCTSYQEIVEIAKKYTKKGTICLLSPAAASYDQFKNFEQRGEVFRQLVLNLFEDGTQYNKK